jgi:hypothetical protein
MIAIDCHIHGSRVLLDWSRIEGVHDSPGGPVVDWHCWCGARGRLIAGTRSEPRPVELVVPAPHPARKVTSEGAPGGDPEPVAS